MKWPRLFRAMTQVPTGPRPSTTFWYDPAGSLPSVQWSPSSGMFQTFWDAELFQACTVPGYWRARFHITESVGAMPLAAWKGVVQVEPTPKVLQKPNIAEDRLSTVAAWVGDLLDHGNAVGRKLYDRDDFRRVVVGVDPWPAAETVVATDSVGGVVYTRHVNGVPVDRVPQSDMFHAKGVQPYPGALRGMGILEVGLSTLSRMRDEAAYAGNAFRSGVPSGLLRVKDPDLQPGDPDDPPGYATARGIKRAWRDSIQTGDVAVLSDLVDFQPLAWTPTDAQMVEARQMSLVDIANLFGCDPYWVGSSQQSAPYQNVQDSAVQFVRFTLNPWIAKLEAQFSALLPGGTEARFNRDTLLAQQRAERVDTELKLLAAEVVTKNDVRGWEGLPPLPDEPEPDVAPVVELFPAESDQDTNEAATGTEE